MLKLTTKIILFPVWLLSILPLEVLLVLSWPIAFLMHSVIGYRKKVVYNNLHNSFPDKSDKEIKKIARRFYLHLSDYFIETINMISIGKKRAIKRYKLVNTEILEKLYKSNKFVIATTSHFGNWEGANTTQLQTPYKLFGVYKPQNNVFFDRIMIYLRTKFGAHAVPMKSILRETIDAMREFKLTIIYMVSDQRPRRSEPHYWTNFLNQQTPVITGTEKLARKFDLAVVFFDIEQIRRGKYEVRVKLITENPKETQEHEITEKYIRLVEEQVRNNPPFYLWSHKRWKFKPQDFK